MSKNTKGKYHYYLNKALISNDKEGIAYNLKNSCDFPTLVSLIEPLKTSSKAIRIELEGIPFPENNADLFQFRKFFRPVEVINELNWIFLSLKTYRKEISDFINKKEIYESLFLLGKYSKCIEILDEIFTKYGYSFWYIEQKFLVYEYQNKPESQKLFLSELNKTGGHIGGLFTKFLSQRTERNLSAYKFDYDIKNLFKRDREDFYQNASSSFYKYSLNYFEYTNPESLPHIILFNNYISIFDKYLATVNIIKSLYVNKMHMDFVIEKSVYLYRRSNDKALLNMILTFLPHFKYHENFIDKDYIEILDSQYAGDNEEVINKVRAYAKTKPVSIEIAKLYAKSLIALDWPFSSIYPENSIAHNISYSVYNILAKPEDSLVMDKLYTTHKNLLTFNLAGELNYFLKSEQNITISDDMRYIFSNRITPFIYKILLTTGLVTDYLETLLDLFPSSLCIKHLKSVSENLTGLNPSIAEEIRKLDLCNIYYEIGNYSKCIEEAKEVIQSFEKNPPIIQKATKYVFESEVKLKNYTEAINIYVSQYLKNPSAVNKIKPENLLEKLRELKYRGIKRTYKLAIFITLTSKDDAEKAFILETVISISGVTMPSELFENFTNTQEEELFFFKCCTSEILKHYIYLNKTMARLEERQKILNYLLQNFTDNSKIYSSQLDHITNEIIIYEGTRKLDESKIYANDQAIIENELYEVDGLFSRLKTIYKIISKNKSVLLLSANSYQLFTISPTSEKKDNDTKYTDSALLEVFSEIFDTVLNKYLFSKFGIVAYLSTRIRHGVLGGEIRPEIDKHNLILNRKSNSLDYHDTQYWTKPYYGLNTSEIRVLNDILSKFSLKIDNIIDEILRNKIQIKINTNNPEGLLNYEFGKEELNYMAYDLAKEENVKVFSQKIIDKIWERTDFNLEIIRDYFNTTVTNDFHSAFTGLQEDIRSHFGEKIGDIHTNIIGCHTIIGNRLKKIGEWFKRTGSTLDNFDIMSLLRIIWQNTEKCYPNGEAQLEINSISEFPLIQSKFYIHFTDLFRIFIDNMFKYSSADNGVKSFKIDIDRQDDKLIATLKNNTTLENCEFFINNSDVNFDDTKLTIEKKSGISKSIKIIKYDLNDIENTLGISYESTGDNENTYILTLTLTINIKTLIVDE